MTSTQTKNLSDYVLICNKYFDSIGLYSGFPFFQYASEDNFNHYHIYVNYIIIKDTWGEDILEAYNDSPANARVFWEHLSEVLYAHIPSPEHNKLNDMNIHFVGNGDEDENEINKFYLVFSFIPQKITIKEV